MLHPLRTKFIANLLSSVHSRLPILSSHGFANVADQLSLPSKHNKLDVKHAASFENEIKKHPDTFGNYSEIASKFEVTKDDPEDVKERRRQREMDRRSASFYIDVIKSHLNNHEYKKAVEVLEERMLKVDRVRPDSYIYDLLISYCGRIGHPREAFRLYNQIKKRGYHVTGGQYTSLFNACANSRNSHYALEVAQKVRKYLSADELHKANIKNYNSMLKAFGRHGDLKTALEVMDNVLERRGKVRDDTYNFLLQACISDSNSGFRHALLVWHRLLQNKTDPSTITFNLMLRATRDCSLGAPEQLHQLMETILSEGSTRSLRKLSVREVAPYSLPAPSSAPLKEGETVPTESCESPDSLVKLPEREEIHSAKILAFTSLRDEEKQSLPNLLAIRPQIGSVVDLASFSTSYHRLMLLGGASGFLKVMDSLKIKPDMKTFTLLLEIIPSTLEMEEDLMNLARMKKIPFDTGFFNMLIKKRSYTYDYKGAKEVLNLMQKCGVQADLMTFGVLALGCQKKEDGEKLIESAREAGFRLNSEILGPLVRHATYHGDMHYVRVILEAMKTDSVKPSAKLLAFLGDFMKKQQHLLEEK